MFRLSGVVVCTYLASPTNFLLNTRTDTSAKFTSGATCAKCGRPLGKREAKEEENEGGDVSKLNGGEGSGSCGSIWC